MWESACTGPAGNAFQPLSIADQRPIRKDRVSREEALLVTPQLAERRRVARTERAGNLVISNRAQRQLVISAEAKQ